MKDSSTNKRPASSKGATSLAKYGPVSIQSLAANPRRGPEMKWYDQLTQNTQLYHNSSNGTAVTNLWLTLFPAQGTSVNTRIGDRVQARQVDVKLWLSNKSDRSNVVYRIFAAILPGVTTGSSAPPVSSLFSGSNYLIAFPKSDEVTLAYDKIVNPDVNSTTIIPSANTGKERSYFHQFSIPLNEVMSINGSNFNDISNIGLYIVPYDAFGTLSTDIIASCAIATRIWYTDS